MTQDHTLRAGFGMDTYIISVASEGNGTISPGGDVLVGAGDDETFTMTPDPCYYIEDVTVDGLSVTKSVNVDENTGTGVYTFENVQQDHSLAAKFAVKTYNLETIAEANGSIQPQGDRLVNCGDNVTFAIMPDACYRVYGLEVDGVSVMSSVAIDPETYIGIYTLENIQADTTIRATFEARSQEVTSTATGSGSINPAGKVVVNCGRESYPFTMTPDPCYYISDVVVTYYYMSEDTVIKSESVMDDVVIDEDTGVGQYQLENIRHDTKVEAIFARYVYDIEVNAGENGSMTPDGNVQVDCMGSVTFTMTRIHATI